MNFDFKLYKYNNNDENNNNNDNINSIDDIDNNNNIHKSIQTKSLRSVVVLKPIFEFKFFVYIIYRYV